MNSADDITRLPDEDHRFDRLVDGELSEQERFVLLSGLDREPDGWRRCARAFLEAQCWKKEFGDLFHAKAPHAKDGSRPVGLVSVASVPASSAYPARRSGWRRNLATALAMAASFLIALALGTQFRRDWSSRLTGANVQPTALLKIDKGTSPKASTGQGKERNSLAGSTLPDPSVKSGNKPDQWEMVTVTSADAPNNGSQSVRVPAVRRDTFDRQLFDQVPDAIPPDVMQALQRTGHEVLQHRELVPMELDDGSHLVVPVDKVEVHFVGRPSL